MKRILIIGATSAIATACARAWAAQGARLFLVGRRAEALRQSADDLQTRGASSVHHHHCLDLLDSTEHGPMLDAATAALGQFDIVLIAHGTLPDQAACEADPEQALAALATNAGSTIALLTALANRLQAQQHGRLAVITSVAGERGRPSNYVYGSTKAAVMTFCEGLRARLFRHGVRVIDIRPGFVATPMTEGLDLPQMLVVRPETVARRIVRGIERGQDVIHAPWFWRIIMRVIHLIPGPVFKRLSL